MPRHTRSSPLAMRFIASPMRGSALPDEGVNPHRAEITVAMNPRMRVAMRGVRIMQPTIPIRR